MGITTAQLIEYASANMPTNDSSTSGGGIDTAGRADLWVVEVPSAQTISVKSSAADTRTVTFYGRNAAGALINESKTLNGTTAVTTTNSFERLNRINISATASVGTIVTVMRTSPADDGVTGYVCKIPGNITNLYRMFYDSQSEAAQTVRYEKLFWRNENGGGLTLNNAIVKLTSNPLSKVKIALEAAKNDTNSVATRKTVPAGGYTFIDHTSTTGAQVPGTTLEDASAIGVWIQYTLAAADSAVKSTFQTQLSGTTV